MLLKVPCGTPPKRAAGIWADPAIVFATALAGAYLVVLGMANRVADGIEAAGPGVETEAQHPIEVQPVEQAAPTQAPRGGSK